SAHVEAIRDELARLLDGITPQQGNVPLYSSLTGRLLEADATVMDGGYWYDNLRNTVEFESATRAALADGHTVFVEVSPHPVLGLGLQGTVEDAAVLGTLRRYEGGLDRFLTSLAEAHCHGVAVDWETVFAGTGARRTDLPTYAFEHQHYWPRNFNRTGDLAGAGLSSSAHPLLAGAVAVAGEDVSLFTSRLSLDSHPWLADHAVLGTVLLPGTAFVELALHAGGRVGCPVLDELTIQAPLVLPERGARALQVMVGAAESDGRRPLTIHSAVPSEDVDAVWTLHASGFVAESQEQAAASAVGMVQWPPAGAEAVPVEGMYDLLADMGYGYGPVFRGLRAVWRRGDDLFVEVGLEGEAAEQAGRFGLHPALLDSALHAIGLTGGVSDLDGPGLPFAWTGVELFAVGSPALRVRMTAGEGGRISLDLADGIGVPVGRIGSLVLRSVSPGQLDGTAAQETGPDSLYRVDWTPKAAPAEPVDAAPTQVVELGVEDSEGVRDAVVRVLGWLQEWVAAERESDARLLVVTRGAVAVGSFGGDPVLGAVWGLLRSAQSGRAASAGPSPRPGLSASPRDAPGPASAPGSPASPGDPPPARVASSSSGFRTPPGRSPPGRSPSPGPAVPEPGASAPGSPGPGVPGTAEAVPRGSGPVACGGVMRASAGRRGR
ncbi:polyketide synthase dehydratase domain-containing protein, partial [Streptomyces chilikensis]|uniref:polyketide synthase dehydratase domain-containing protein n=1 Tax=Streptomyces chilikensis TaxID=1194079 RepID=UPI00140C074D